MKYEKTGPMTMLSTRYNETVADVVGDVGKPDWDKEARISLRSTVKKFKTVYVEFFDKHCNSNLYHPEYYLLERTV